MSYVVRWTPVPVSPLSPLDHTYLGAPSPYYGAGRANVIGMKNAHRFATLDEAADAIDAKPGYRKHLQALELTYALRWYTSGVPSDYMGGYPPMCGSSRKDARRAETAKEAREWTDPALFVGAGGPDDRVGYKVVCLLRKVKS